jgi:hypothetical protein
VAGALGDHDQPRAKRAGVANRFVNAEDLKIFAPERLAEIVLERVIQAEVSRRGARGLWRSRAVGRIRVRHAVGHLDHRRAGQEFERERDAGAKVVGRVPVNIE